MKLNNVEKIKAEYPVGTRIELVYMDDPQALPRGSRGTVTGVDGAGDLLMRWDNGRGLKLIPGVDYFKKV